MGENDIMYGAGYGYKAVEKRLGVIECIVEQNMSTRFEKAFRRRKSICCAFYVWSSEDFPSSLCESGWPVPQEEIPNTLIE